MSRLDLAVAVDLVDDVRCPCFNCSPPSPDVLRDLVASAARRLDAAAPGWRSRLDRDALDMVSCAWCVLGQVFGDYSTGLHALYGLEAAFGTLTVPRDAQTFGVYPPLRDAWLAELDRDPVEVEVEVDAGDGGGDDEHDDRSRDRDLAIAGTRVTAAVARRSLDALLARPFVVATAPRGRGRSLLELLVGTSS